MSNSLVSVQIIPTVPAGEQVYDFVDAAIKVIEDAGVNYEVNALDTTMEGELHELLPIIEEMNDKMVELGATKVISQIKTLYVPEGIEAKTLTEKYR